jgi:glucosamine-6-phosphate deaminase
MTELLRKFSSRAGNVLVYPDPETASQEAAARIAEAIADSVAARGRAVLGLATGGTPVPVYRNLVALHRLGRVAFDDVSTYNLDEYYPISPADPQSYHAYMHEHLFGKVRIAANRTHVLDGTVPEAFVDEACARFDSWIAAEGGLDLQLLGIGRNGHIGFNEPCGLPVDEFAALPTRLAELHPVTIEDSARDFEGRPDRVPRRALTLGPAPILAARVVLILAFGPRKAQAVRAALDGPVTAELPASLLQRVSEKTTWIVDEAALGAA